MLIGVDGGATGTRARVADSAGQTLGEGRAGPSSLTLGIAQAWANVQQAVAEATEAAGLDPAAIATAQMATALAGTRNPVNLAAFLDACPYRQPPMVLTDGHASVLGAFDGRPGAVVAVGTGVAGHRRFGDGAVREVSGWGFPVGDEGGGAWIGRQAIAVLLHHVDGRRPQPGPLVTALTDLLGDTVAAIQSWLYPTSATRYATLAPVVLNAAAEHDAAAIDILARAGAAIVEVVRALDGYGAAAPALALTGGLAQPLNPWLPATLTARAVQPIGTALDGAVLALVPR